MSLRWQTSRCINLEKSLLRQMRHCFLQLNPSDQTIQIIFRYQHHTLLVTGRPGVWSRLLRFTGFSAGLLHLWAVSASWIGLVESVPSVEDLMFASLRDLGFISGRYWDLGASLSSSNFYSACTAQLQSVKPDRCRPNLHRLTNENHKFWSLSNLSLGSVLVQLVFKEWEILNACCWCLYNVQFGSHLWCMA